MWKVLYITFSLVPVLAGYFAWIFAIKKSKKKRMDEVSRMPQVWELYGISDTAFPIPIPGKLLKREVWRELPSELKGTEPLLSLPNGLVIPGKPRTFTKKYVKEILELEKATVQRIIFSGLVTMSDKLGVNSGFGYKQSVRGLKSTKVVSQKNELNLFGYGVDYIDVYMAKHLCVVCSSLGLDYDSVCELGGYESGRSSYAGFGSWGAISAGVMLSEGSAMKAKMNNNFFMLANFRTAFNNTVDYFNSQYFAQEYEKWRNENTEIFKD
jgi:hypothetical protein